MSEVVCGIPCLPQPIFQHTPKVDIATCSLLSLCGTAKQFLISTSVPSSLRIPSIVPITRFWFTFLRSAWSRMENRTTGSMDAVKGGWGCNELVERVGRARNIFFAGFLVAIFENGFRRRYEKNFLRPGDNFWFGLPIVRSWHVTWPLPNLIFEILILHANGAHKSISSHASHSSMLLYMQLKYIYFPPIFFKDER